MLISLTKIPYLKSQRLSFLRMESRNKQSLENGSEPWLYPEHTKHGQENDAWKSDWQQF